MDLLLGTLLLRPYVFTFLAAFLAAALLDIGLRAVVFACAVWPVAWLAEYSSTRIGVPFGLYHYTETTRGHELFIANVPLFDSLSFVFLAYAAWCLARVTLESRPASRAAVAGLAGVLMMALDLVIDPLAVRGDRWFLGRIFFYPDGGVYFGVPLSNFAGWVVVGMMAVGGYLALTRDGAGRRPAGGVALYYAVAASNLAMTAWIGEWALATVGLAIHSVIVVALRYLAVSTEVRLYFGRRGVRRA